MSLSVQTSAIAFLLGAVAFCGNAWGMVGDVQLTDVERIRIQYEASPGCPAKETLITELGRRVTIPWVYDDTPLARQIRVVALPNVTGFEGRMEYVDDSGQLVTRSLNAPDCAQAMSGVALVIAIAIESRVAQNVALPPRAEAAVAADPDGGASESGATNRVVAEPSSSSITNPPSSTVSMRGFVTPRAYSWSHEVGVRGGGTYGIGPGVSPAGSLFWGIERSALPQLRLAAGWNDNRHAVSGVDVRFRLISFDFALCHAFTPSSARGFQTAFCGGVQMGQHRVKGETATVSSFDTRSRRLFWGAVELLSPMRWREKWAFVELQPIVRFPLTSGSFVVRGKTDWEHQIPRVIPELNLAVGVTF